MPSAPPTAPLTARRIIVYGVSGSGKSETARRLGERTGLPVVSVDDLMWLPGWEPVPVDRQREIAADVVAADSWILDAAYGAWRDLALGRAELVVGLDLPRLFCLQRLLRRTASRLVRRTEVCNGNRESLRVLFAKDSIVLWQLQAWGRHRARMRAWAAAQDGPPVLLLRSSRAVEGWLASLGRPGGADRLSPRR